MGDAKLIGQSQQRMLRGPNPLAAEIDPTPLDDGPSDHPAADPIPGLEDHQRVAGVSKCAGRDKPREPGADHDHIDRPTVGGSSSPEHGPGSPKECGTGPEGGPTEQGTTRDSPRLRTT